MGNELPVLEADTLQWSKGVRPCNFSQGIPLRSSFYPLFFKMPILRFPFKFLRRISKSRTYWETSFGWCTCNYGIETFPKPKQMWDGLSTGEIWAHCIMCWRLPIRSWSLPSKLPQRSFHRGTSRGSDIISRLWNRSRCSTERLISNVVW
jgi:hypothetical protein